MKITLLFPVLQIITCLGACIVYFIDKDINKGLYWFFAFGIATVVTFKIF